MKLAPWTYFVVFFIGIFLCWYVMRGCQEPAPDHSDDMKKIDSLVTIVTSHTKETNRFKDSADKVISSLQKDKDSVIAITKIQKIDLNKRGEDIQGILDELDASEAAKDTLRTLTECKELKAQFASAKGLVGAYMYANDSLQKLNEQIIASKTEITGRLSQQLTETNNAFFSTQLTLQNIEADYNKLKGKSNKRFSIGPSIGYYVTPNGS